MSTSRKSLGTWSQNLATCALSETSSWIAVNFPPWDNPDSLYAAEHLSTTCLSISSLRATSMTFEPACGEQGKSIANVEK